MVERRQAPAQPKKTLPKSFSSFFTVRPVRSLQSVGSYYKLITGRAMATALTLGANWRAKRIQPHDCVSPFLSRFELFHD